MLAFDFKNRVMLCNKYNEYLVLMVLWGLMVFGVLMVLRFDSVDVGIMTIFFCGCNM